MSNEVSLYICVLPGLTTFSTPNSVNHSAVCHPPLVGFQSGNFSILDAYGSFPHRVLKETVCKYACSRFFFTLMGCLPALLPYLYIDIFHMNNLPKNLELRCNTPDLSLILSLSLHSSLFNKWQPVWCSTDSSLALFVLFCCAFQQSVVYNIT